MNRIGIGQDSHKFERERNKPLILGGVKIPDEIGLLASSDGDVFLHSICNALSSAIGGDSLGTWADSMCLEKKVTDSKEYVNYIFQKVKKLGFIVGNISISVEAKRPRLPFKVIYEIKEQISKLLEINIDQVGITFTSGDNLTAFGRGEGIQAIVIVNLLK